MESKPKVKIHFIQAIFMIGVAIIFDLTQAGIDLISLGTLGPFLNIIVDALAFMTFFMWFALSGVSFVKPGKIFVLCGTALIEAIPWINDLPAWSFGVIITLAMVYAEDIVALISPEAAKALATALNKINGKGLQKKPGVPSPQIPKPAGDRSNVITRHNTDGSTTTRPAGTRAQATDPRVNTI